MRINFTGASVRRQRGFSLVEIAMVLAIAALILAGVMLFFASASTGQKITDTFSELAAIQQTVRSLYAGQPTYNGLTSIQLATTGQLPAKWIPGGIAGATGINDPFNGPITVIPAASGGGVADALFSVEMDGLPAAACSKLATTDMGTGVYALSVNGTPTAVPGSAMTPAQANQTCGQLAASKIIWTFF